MRDRSAAPKGGATAPVAADRRPYHHGDLRRVVVHEVLSVVAERGPAAVSLRDIARRAGVAHTSVAHHFRDKSGVFTAVAAEGYRLLGDELRAVVARDEGFLELGVAYVRFAVTHRSHFEVMFRPDLYDPHDVDVVAAREMTGSLLYGGAAQIQRRPSRADATPNPRTVAGVAGWAMVHGIASLWLAGNLPAALGDDPEAITRVVARLLGPPD